MGVSRICGLFVGLPKGVCLSHGNMIANLLQMDEVEGIVFPMVRIHVSCYIYSWQSFISHSSSRYPIGSETDKPAAIFSYIWVPCIATVLWMERTRAHNHFQSLRSYQFL